MKQTHTGEIKNEVIIGVRIVDGEIVPKSTQESHVRNCPRSDDDKKLSQNSLDVMNIKKEFHKSNSVPYSSSARARKNFVLARLGSKKCKL
jgi:hypothetical protein